MKAYGIISAFAIAAAAMVQSACTEEIFGTQEQKYEYRSRETIALSITASIDPDALHQLASENPEEALAAAPFWVWTDKAQVSLLYDCDGMTAVQEPDSMRISGENATFFFGKIPAEATLNTLVLGSEQAFGQILDEPSLCGVYATASLDCPAGTTSVEGVKLLNRCAYFDIYVPFLNQGGVQVGVTDVTFTGTGIMQDPSVQSTFVIPGSDPSSGLSKWIPVALGSKEISVSAKMETGNSMQLMSVDEPVSGFAITRVRDFLDPSECIGVRVSARLDPAEKQRLTGGDVQLERDLSELWKWDAQDPVTVKYSIGSYRNSCLADEVTVDPSDPSKAEIHFPLIPKEAVIGEIVLGSTEAFGKAGGTVARDMIYAGAPISCAKGTESLEEVTLKSKCSYIRMEISDIEGNPVNSVTLSGDAISDSGTSATFELAWDQQGGKWVALSNEGTALKANAFTSAGEYFLASIADAGKGTASILKVSSQNYLKITYRTVIYSDGTMIIDEMSTDAEANRTLHGDPAEGAENLPSWHDQPSLYAFSAKGASGQPWKTFSAFIKRVEFGSLIHPAVTAFWFAQIPNLKSIDFSNLDTSRCVNMNSMFNASMTDMGNPVDLDLSSFDVSALSDSKALQNFLYKATGVRSVDVSGWKIKRTFDCQNMFQSYNGALTTIYADKNTDFTILTMPGANSANMFKNNPRLVGGNGTVYTATTAGLSATFARLDTPTTPGYFTLKIKE